MERENRNEASRVGRRVQEKLSSSLGFQACPIALSAGARLSDFGIVPSHGVMMLTTFFGPWGASPFTERAARLVVQTVTENCKDASSAVSVHVLNRERERIESYSIGRLVASIRLANERVIALADEIDAALPEQAEDLKCVRSASLVAVYTAKGRMHIVSIGVHVNAFRARGGQVERLAGKAPGELPTNETWKEWSACLAASNEIDLNISEHEIRPGDWIFLSSNEDDLVFEMAKRQPSPENAMLAGFNSLQKSPRFGCVFAYGLPAAAT